MKNREGKKGTEKHFNRNILILSIAILHQPISKIIDNKYLLITFNLAYVLLAIYFIILLLKDMGGYSSKTQ